MGVLIKIALFGLVIYYIFKTIGGFVFRILGGQAQQDQPKHKTQQKRAGEINIDYVPKGNKRKQNNNSNDEEYIDFEDV